MGVPIQHVDYYFRWPMFQKRVLHIGHALQTSVDANLSKVGVVLFFWFLYHCCAEPLPTTFTTPRRAGKEAPFLDSCRDEDFSLRVVNKFVEGLNTYCENPDLLNIGPGSFAGSRRHLPHTSRTELYWEYRAAVRSGGTEDAASYSQFLKVANKILGPRSFGSHLGIRKVCQHGSCNTCFDMKTAIRNAKTAAERSDAYTAYSHHLLAQWLDRQIYWQFRKLSQNWFFSVRPLGLKKPGRNH